MEEKTLYPVNRKDWRNWLSKNHDVNQTVWVACTKKNAAQQTISQGEAVDEALCYGWIDGTARSLDEEKWLQSFTQRKHKSVWSKVNKGKVEKLIAAGLMQAPGYKSIEIAKANGYWSILDDVEEGIIPHDLQVELDKSPSALDYFNGMSLSERKALLKWLVLAQRPETRQKRIIEIVEASAQQTKQRQFR